MKVACPSCFREDVEVKADGKLENHYPSAKISLTPTSHCGSSGLQVVDLDSLNINCPDCDLPVTTDIDGNIPQHYPNPLKGFSVEEYCGSPHGTGRGGQQATAYRYVPDPNQPSARFGRR